MTGWTKLTQWLRSSDRASFTLHICHRMRGGVEKSRITHIKTQTQGCSASTFRCKTTKNILKMLQIEMSSHQSSETDRRSNKKKERDEVKLGSTDTSLQLLTVFVGCPALTTSALTLCQTGFSQFGHRRKTLKSPSHDVEGWCQVVLMNNLK